MSDAVLAIALDSGKILWTRQLLVGDMGKTPPASQRRRSIARSPMGRNDQLAEAGSIPEQK
jgi:hypothetical protein